MKIITKISGLMATALILGSASIASAATVARPARHPAKHHPVMLLEDSGRPAVGSYAGYSADPETRTLEILADKYRPGW